MKRKLKEEKNKSKYPYGDMAYIRNPKESHQETSRKDKNLSEMAGYKISLQKNSSLSIHQQLTQRERSWKRSCLQQHQQ